MSRRERSAIAHLFSFGLGYLAAFGLLVLMGWSQHQDEQDVAELRRVIACSQVAGVCNIAMNGSGK